VLAIVRRGCFVAIEGPEQKIILGIFLQIHQYQCEVPISVFCQKEPQEKYRKDFG
jgi:hypothetical protein